MGKEEKKSEEQKMEEKKPGEEKKPTAVAEGEEKKTAEIKDGKENKEAKENSPPPPPSPAPEIVLGVYMHCEGCARKFRRSLKGFEGVEEVETDWKANKVIVKGENADPIKVLQRVQRKSHRQIELLSPIPAPPSPEEKNADKKEQPKPVEKKEEIVTVVLRVHMHCEGCAEEIKKRILRMKEVESAEPDLKTMEVTVKGSFDPQKLIEYVYKRTGKHAVIVKQEAEKKVDNGGGKEKKREEAEEETEGKKEESAIDETKVVEVKKNEYNYYPQQPYTMEMMYAYPPQMFSDENPNACSVM